MSNTTVSTGAASKLALMHVLDNFIQCSKISNAFKKSGYDEITDILQLNDLEIEYDVMKIMLPLHILYKRVIWG
jgi:hypothetical protein